MYDHLTDIRSSDQHAVKPWFNGKLDFAPSVADLADNGYPLEGGRLDYLGGRTVAALIFARREHKINLFVLPMKTDEAMRDLRRAGFNLISWTSASLRYVAISDLNEPELRAFSIEFRSVTGG
jgi:anti-sigma factor RsiW